MKDRVDERNDRGVPGVPEPPKYRARRARKAGVLVWPGIFWILAFLAPLTAVLMRAIGAPEAIRDIVASSYYRGVFAFTIRQAWLSTLFSVVIGLPGAALIATFRFPGRRLLKALTTVPFVLPSILAVLGFILVFGNSGLVNSLRRLVLGPETEPWKILYSIRAIVMAHVFYNFPLTLRIVGDAWGSLSRNPRRAARSLGAGSVRTFLTVDLPRLLPSILTAGLLTFIYCFMSFTIILILGGGPQLSTLEVEVYRLVKYGLDFSSGSALALVESLFILTLMGLYAVLGSRSSRWLRDEGSSQARITPRRLQGIRGWAAMAYLVPALLLILAPLLAIVANSFLGRTTRSGGLSLTPDNWLRIFGIGPRGSQVALGAIGRSMALSLGVGFVTTFTAGMSAWYSVTVGGKPGRTADIIMSAPMSVSSVILGLGYLMLSHRLPGSPVLRMAAVVMVHTVIALPFAHRIIADRFRSISPRVRQAARAAGAGPVRSFFRIELPLARKSLVTAAVFAMALSAGEMNATLILAPTGFTTVPLAIYRMIGAYDIYGACALGSILIAVSAAAFFVLDRFAEESI